MTGYKDKTWCPAHISNECANKSVCHRVFTERDREGAIRWWGGEDFPLVTFAEKPKCFVPITVLTEAQ